MHLETFRRRLFGVMERKGHWAWPAFTSGMVPKERLHIHPLVKHHGLPLEHLALTKAHREVEGEHRAAAWKASTSG